MNIVDVFRIAHKVVAVIPEPLGRGIFNVVGTVVGWSNYSGAVQLRKNLQRIKPVRGALAERRRSAAGLRSYMRYYYELFRLPALTQEQIDARVTIEGHEVLTDYLARDTSVPAVLMHMGNWDLAGRWAHKNLAKVHTIAEKLEPPELGKLFYDFRESAGMKIYLAVKGGGAISHLEEDMRNETILVPILCDRDLSASGVEVELCGKPIRVAVGSALLAQRTGQPMFPISIVTSRFSDDRDRVKRAGTSWGIRIIVDKEIFPNVAPDASSDEREEDLVRMNQEWMDQMTEFLPNHVEDWHMLQKVFVEDLDQARLASNRAKKVDREDK